MSVSPLKELFAQATNNTTINLNTTTNTGDLIELESSNAVDVVTAAPQSAVRQPALTPRASNLPQPSVFSKNTRSPFAPMMMTTTPSPVPSSTASSVGVSVSDGATNSNLPTPTFRGTPPVTPFLTQRRGRYEIRMLCDVHFSGVTVEFLNFFFFFFFFFFSFVMADSPAPQAPTSTYHNHYNITGVIPTIPSDDSPVPAEPVMPSPPTTVRLLSPSALTPNTVRDVRNFQPTPAARITASVRKAASMISTSTTPAAAAPPQQQADVTAILSTAAILAHAATVVDEAAPAAPESDVVASAPSAAVPFAVPTSAIDETTLSFYELQRREVAQRRELATAKKAQAQRRRAESAAADEPKPIATSLSMAAAPTTNGEKSGIARRHSTLTRQLPPVPRIARPAKPAAAAAAAVPARGRARSAVEEAVSAAASSVQAQYQLGSLPEFFVQQVEVANDGQTAKYTLAGHTYNVMMRGRKCMVRTGGGWVAIATFMAEALERSHESLVTAANPTLETKRARSRSRSRSRSRRAQQQPPQPLEEGAFGAYSDEAEAAEEVYHVVTTTMPIEQPVEQPVVSVFEAPLAAPKRLSVAPKRAPAPAPFAMPSTKWRLEVPPPLTQADLVGMQERKRFQLDAFPTPFQSGEAAEQLALVYDCFFVEAEDNVNNGDDNDDDVHLTLDELRTKLPDFSEEKLEIFLELLESRHLLKAIAIEYGDGEAQLAWQRIGM
jgi:hypothetical protein